MSDESIIVGRNSVTEALRAGRSITKLYIAAGNDAPPLLRIQELARENPAEAVRALKQINLREPRAGLLAGAVAVCDATCLERGLDLALQVLELQPRTVVCVNLLDEGARKGLRVDLEALSRAMGVPVAGTSAGREEATKRARSFSVFTKPFQPLVRLSASRSPKERCTGTVGVYTSTSRRSR